MKNSILNFLPAKMELYLMCTGNGDGSKGSNSPDRVNFDWREFRANLFAQEKVSVLYLLGCISISF